MQLRNRYGAAKDFDHAVHGSEIQPSVLVWHGTVVNIKRVKTVFFVIFLHFFFPILYVVHF